MRTDTVMNKGRVLVAMSGGVDSTMAAYLLQQSGFECVGCTMKLHGAGTADEHRCSSMSDMESARAAADKLGIPHYVYDFAGDFKEKVIDKFIKSYQEGRTPNPCVECNRCMKFSRLFEEAESLGCDYAATGHYVRIEEKASDDGSTEYLLKKAVDESKDQSYVLYTLTQKQLAHTKFPLGGMTKSDIRAAAAEQGFDNADRPDSQDICFVPDGDYVRVIESYTGQKPEKGNFVDHEGNILGSHDGIIHYTIGQRKGLGKAFGRPVYVCEIRAESREVVLGSNDDLFRRSLYAGDFNWISGRTPAGRIRCKAKIRYRHREEWAFAEAHDDGTVTVVFDEPQRAITPGQSVVLYDGDVVLGGGIIIGEGCE